MFATQFMSLHSLAMWAQMASLPYFSWIAFDKPAAHEAVRSLLRKINIEVVELEENREKTKFCGPNLCAPCTESNAELAHKRYVEDFPYMFTPMDADEQIAHFHEHCAQIETDKAVCYCKFCTDGINMGGKTGVPTNPTLPNMKQNANTRSRSCGRRISLAIPYMSAVMPAYHTMENTTIGQFASSASRVDLWLTDSW